MRGDRRVFAGLGFDLPAGGALVLTGPNGSGKSSLLRLLAGLLPPAAGRLTWQGRSVASDLAAHRARLHYIGHLDAVKPVLTAAENLAFWATDPAAVAPALAQFDLAWLAEVPGRLLSAGQRRRLALARLLAAPADLWLLDEPGVGLDTPSLACLAQAMAAHRAAGGCLVAATHQALDLPDADELSLSDFAAGPEPDWTGDGWPEAAAW